MIVVTLRGEPEGRLQPQPRIVRRRRDGKMIVILHPAKKTAAYQRALELQAKVVMGSRPPLSGAVAVAVTAVFSVPSSWSNKKRDAALAGVVRHTSKPDWDNVAKNVGDALKGVVWIEDAIIVDGSVRKVYGEEPHLRVEVRQLEDAGGLIAGMTGMKLPQPVESL